MNYNGKEIEVTCTLENDTPKITIFGNDLKIPFTFNDINRAAVFLASVYGGTKEEAVLALNNLLQEQAFIALDNLLQKQSNEKGQEDRCIEISMKDFFSMSYEEFEEYMRKEFLKKGIDIDNLNPPSLDDEEDTYQTARAPEFLEDEEERRNFLRYQMRVRKAWEES